jgi:FKBP-type peptidyl-prolyl cis-trans isomerase 2
MNNDKKNKQVAVFLQGTLENGEIFEKTPPDHPVVITLGQNRFFPVIEKELFDMKPGETRTFTLTPDQAYGPRHEHLVQTIDRSVFGSRIDPQPGMILSLSLEGDNGPEKVPATVVSADQDHVVVDYNHPLAGKNVTYEVTLQSYIS